MSEPVRIAVLGNSFANRVQLPALRWASEAGGAPNRVVAIAGRDGAKARATAEAWGIERATSDWRSALDASPDLVLVSTPVHLHHAMALAAFDVGAAVLCEKPFALDAHQGDEMLAASERSARGAWLDHQLRWSPHLRAMRERVESGFLGEPWHARIEMFLPSPGLMARPYSWWFDAERGGGMLGAIGSHLLDLLRFLWGDVDAVRAELRTWIPERRDPDGELHRVTADEFASLSLRFANGALGELVTTFAVPDERELYLQLTGSEGALRVVDGASLEELRPGEAPRTVDVPPPLTSTEYGMEQDYGLFSRCLPLYLADVVRAVRERRTTVEGAATFRDGLATQRVLDAARASARAGGGWTDIAIES